MREAVTVLQTERLILRKFCPPDVGALAAVLSDPETMRFYPSTFRSRRSPRMDRTELPTLCQKRNRTVGNGLEIQRRIDRRLWFGAAGSDGEELVEIGYHVRRDLWGNGLATEAARACRDFGFSRLGVERLISLIRPENLPSRRVAEKTGMSVWKETIWRGIPHLVYAVQPVTLLPKPNYGAGNDQPLS